MLSQWGTTESSRCRGNQERGWSQAEAPSRRPGCFWRVPSNGGKRFLTRAGTGEDHPDSDVHTRSEERQRESRKAAGSGCYFSEVRHTAGVSSTVIVKVEKRSDRSGGTGR